MAVVDLAVQPRLDEATQIPRNGSVGTAARDDGATNGNVLRRVSGPADEGRFEKFSGDAAVVDAERAERNRAAPRRTADAYDQAGKIAERIKIEGCPIVRSPRHGRVG